MLTTVYSDIGPYWNMLMPIVSFTSYKLEYGNFFGHNDMDMLEVGNGNLTEVIVTPLVCIHCF